MEEIWKIYKDNRKTPNGSLWEVSTFGRIKKDGLIYIPTVINSGYLCFSKYLVHRAVAECFIENTDNKKCVDHIDDNKLNNNVTNLRWVTHYENNHKKSHHDKLVKSLKERQLSDDAKTNIVNAVKKWWELKEHHSDDTKEKMSKIRKEWWETHEISEEEHIRRSNASKGKKLTEEHKNKIKQNAANNKNYGMKNKHHSKETRKILSEKRKLYWENYKKINNNK